MIGSGSLAPLAALLGLGAMLVLGSAALLDGRDEDPAPAVAAATATTEPAESSASPRASVADGTVVEPSTSPPVATGIAVVEPERLVALPLGMEPTEFVLGPRGRAIFIDTKDGSVKRVDLETGVVGEIVRAPDAEGRRDGAIGTPVQLGSGGPDVVIVDDDARVWRWRPGDGRRSGLRRIVIQRQPDFESGHGDMAVYTSATTDYRIYVADPDRGQIMRYQQTLDGSAFSRPSPYLASATSEVVDFEQLYVDFDLYALIGDTLRRHQYGKLDAGFMLADPPIGATGAEPDDRLVAGSGRGSTDGRVYLYDAANHRIVGFSKESGGFLAEWTAPGTEMDDIRGLEVIEGGLNRRDERRDDTLVWVTSEGIYRTALAVDATT